MKISFIALIIVFALTLSVTTVLAEELTPTPTAPKISEELLTNFIKTNQCLAGLGQSATADQHQLINWLAQIVDDPLACDVVDPALKMEMLSDHVVALKAMAMDLTILRLGRVSSIIRRTEMQTLRDAFDACALNASAVAARNPLNHTANEFMCVLDLWGDRRKDLMEKYNIQLP